jgi:hypothetical protein
MKNLASAALCGLAVLALLCASAATAPKPQDVATKWELGFESNQPRPIRLQVPGEKTLSTFWYIPYTVTNQTDDEQIFVPEFVLYTDTGQILQAGKNVPSVVFTAIQKELNEPLLKDMVDISKGSFLRGANNARQGVMIFTDIDPEAGSFDIFVGGLSGETVKIQPPNPIGVETRVDGNKRVEMKSEVFLSKTRKLHYSLPGEASARFTTPPILESDTWVMR